MSKFTSRDHLEEHFKEKGAEILAYLDDEENEVGVDSLQDPPLMKQKIRWSCANDPSHILIGRITTITQKERERYLCRSCGARTKSFASVQAIIDLFESKGSKVLAIIGKDNKEYPLNRIPDGREKIKWQCAKNKNHTPISPLKNALVGDRDLLLCRGCAISEARNGATYETFTKQLKEKSWKMVGSKAQYTNNKSMMKVVCDKNHSIETSQNRFSNGHGCKICATEAQRRHTIPEIAKEFEQKGFRLLAKVYTNNATPLDYMCKCGRIRKISYSNFTTNLGGCKECTRRWTHDEVDDYFTDNGCVLLYAGDDPVPKAEFVLNCSKVSYMCFCSNFHRSTWQLFKNGARCPECTKASIRETCMAMYGVDNPFKSEDIKQKIRQSMMDRYGAEYAMQIEEFCQRAKETNIINHGGVHNLTLPEIREKSDSAYQEKYGNTFGKVEAHQEKGRRITKERLGVEFPLQSKEIQAKVKKNNLEKYGNEVYIISETGKKQMLDEYGSEHYVTSEASKQRMLDEYGSEYYINSVHFTDGMIEKYGVPHAMQNPDLLSKALYTAFSSKDYHTSSGATWRIQGYENYALNLLFADGFAESDIIVGCANVPAIKYMFEGKQHIYYPDIYIEKLNLVIEVKSQWTYQRDYDKNIAKCQETSKHHNFELWIFNKNGERILKRPFVTCELIFED